MKINFYWDCCGEFNLRYDTNAMIDSLVEKLQSSPRKCSRCFVVIGKFNNKEILWFSKWNQSTYSKQGSVSKAYLLEDIVQKSFHNLGLLRKFKLSKFNFWEIQGIPQSWFDLVWWVELIEYPNPQQGWSPTMIIHIWIKLIKIDM